MKVNLATPARYRGILLSLVLLLVCLAGHAQQNSTITGTVLDKGGAAVPGAEVMLTQQGTGFVTKSISNDSGNYTFPGLNVGTYDLKVTAKGFSAYVQKGIVVNVSQTTRVDAAMAVGTVDQTVTVQADTLTVQTDSNVVSTLVSEEQITSNRDREPELCSLSRAWTRRQFHTAGQQHANLGWFQCKHQRERASSEPQHLVDRRRRSR